MKIEHENKSWMGASIVLAALALCAPAAAQGAVRDVRGNLLNDLRDTSGTGHAVGGYGRVRDAGSMEVPQNQDLGFDLTVTVEPYDASSLHAIFPGKKDMKKFLRLNGRRFAPVALQITLDQPATTGRVTRGYTIRGEIGANGSMVIELPAEVETSGVFVQGYSPIDNDFTPVMDLDQAVEEAYLSWTVEAIDQPSHGFARPKQQILGRDAQRTAKPSHGVARPKQRLFGWDAQRTAKPSAGAAK